MSGNKRIAIGLLVAGLSYCSQAIGQNGIITTVAGNGMPGYSGDGGQATSASLTFNEDDPLGVAVDAAGNLFIADFGNGRIRKVSPGGIITTVAGGGFADPGDGGPATSARLGPTGVAVDRFGNIYIAADNRIQKVSPSGIITTVAGNGSCGFSGDGGLATSAALCGDGLGVAVDSAGDLFIADARNARIRKVSASGIITTIAGNGSTIFCQVGPCLDDGDGGPATLASLYIPQSVAVDTSGNLFIADQNDVIRKVSANGIITTVAGGGTRGLGDGGPATSAVLTTPYGVAVDASGNIFIADRDAGLIRKVSASTGIITTVAGGGTPVHCSFGPCPGIGDGGPAISASLALPLGVAVDSSGNLFIAVTSGAYGNGEIRKVSASASAQAPAITSGGVVPVYSTVTTIQPGEWVSIYGNNLASSAMTWNGDFPTSLDGTSVTINDKAAYLWFVSPTQINLQAPNDTATGAVPVVVKTANGTSLSTVTLAQFAPSFLLLDSKHVAGIISRSDGSGAYGGGSYDILGPNGTSLGYATAAAKAGDIISLFGVGFGPTMPAVLAGRLFSGAAATTNPVTLVINNVSVTPLFAGLSEAGTVQINLIVPAGLGTGDVALLAQVGGAQTQKNVVFSLQ